LPLAFGLLPFAFARLLREQRYYKQEKKQILKNNSNIFKDWTISREVKSLG